MKKLLILSVLSLGVWSQTVAADTLDTVKERGI